jgi:hypothetical protein
MNGSGHVVREIALVGLSKTYRSAVRMVRSLRTAQPRRAPVSREMLARASGGQVVVTTRDGRVLIGRLWLAREHAELWQMVHGIPCRQRFACEDILSCYVYSDSEMWDETTQPAARNEGRVVTEDGETSGPMLAMAAAQPAI